MKSVLFKVTFTAVATASFLIVALSSLAFCSNSGRPYCHSFLYDNYPELRQQAEELPLIDDAEKVLSEMMENVSAEMTIEEFMFNECFHPEGLFNTNAKATASTDNDLVKLADTQMAKQRDSLSRSPLNELLFCGKIYNPKLTVLEDLLLSAMDMHHKIQAMNPDPDYSAVVFLGRSPCFLQVAMEELSKKSLQDINLPLIHINYSGHADALTKRAAQLHQGNKGIALNMVTKDKLHFYMAYLSLKKLQCYKQLFVVDIIGTGSGIRSWLGLLETLMHSMDLTMPKLHLFVLTPFVRTIGAFNENADGFYNDDTRLFAYSSSTKKIIFEEVNELNVKAMEIDVTPIHIGITTQRMVDHPLLQGHCTHGSFFPSQYWTDKGYAITRNGGDCHKIIYATLRLSFSRIIDIYFRILKQIERDQLK